MNDVILQFSGTNL